MDDVNAERTWISREMLKEFGYSFETEYEELLFVEIVNQNFLYELGLALCEKMSQKQTETVRRILDTEKPLSKTGMEGIYSLIPNQKRTTKRVYKKYIKHLKKYRNIIMKDIRKWREASGFK